MSNPETLFGGKYKTVRSLGEGGMGTVFEVENVLTHKRAAIKLLHPRLQTGPAFAGRMLREARAMARIRHQNVVDVYDVLLDDDGICLVMELLHGELLSDRLAETSLSIVAFLELLLPAMRGVAAAHAVGVVHRDIKPENIFLAIEGGQARPTPKVIDFGISKVFNADEDLRTCSGVAMGTPRYVSYEQLRGMRDVDGRTDTYAFGVILFEALTGRPPYVAETLGQQAIQFVTTVPPALRSLRPDIPEALAKSVERAISRDREHRHESLNELVEELAPFLHDQPILQPMMAFPPKSEGLPSRTHEQTIAWQTTHYSRADRPASTQASSLAPPAALPAHATRTSAWPRRALGVAFSFALAASLIWAASSFHSPTRAELPAHVATEAGEPSKTATRVAPASPQLVARLPVMAEVPKPMEPPTQGLSASQRHPRRHRSLANTPSNLRSRGDGETTASKRILGGASEEATATTAMTASSVPALPTSELPAEIAPDLTSARSGGLTRSEF